MHGGTGRQPLDDGTALAYHVSMRTTLIILLATLATTAHATNNNVASNDVQACLGRQYEMPSGATLVCSATWRFDGPCDGQDLWDRWKVSGPTEPSDSFVRPWLDERIFVIGYEMTKITGEPHDFFMIGSGIVADAFLWMPSDRNHARIMFQHGHGHPWPTKQESEAQRKSVNDLIDIHGSCRPSPSPVPAQVSMLTRLKGVARWLLGRKDAPAPAPAPAARQATVFLTVYFTPWKRPRTTEATASQ